jgi:Putative auto-transporter adhesin, head GIN domain
MQFSNKHQTINTKHFLLMKYLVQILFLLTSFTGFAQKQFVVDPDAEVREVVGSFTSIKVSNAIHLYLSKGDAEAIAISADEEKYKQGIKTEIENGELHIFYDGPRVWNGRNQKLSVYVSYKSLEQITASSASNVLLAGIMELPILNIKISGASDFKGQLNIGELNVKISGASDMRLSGIVKNINVECSGASDFKSYDLVAENGNIKASGASDVSITVNKEITANASGASNVYYKGDAIMKEKHSSGASSIAKEN